MDEGYLALYVSIIKEIPPERAFLALGYPTPYSRGTKENHKPKIEFTAEAWEAVHRLRMTGVNWRAIAKKYQVSVAELKKFYARRS